MWVRVDGVAVEQERIYCKWQVDSRGRRESERCRRVAGFRVGVESEGVPTKIRTNVSVQQERANGNLGVKFRGVMRKYGSGYRKLAKRM